MEKTYRVRELAELAGVTVRTLHHYDRIGLLAPSRRTSSGHRVYRDLDLLRLQQIQTLKALGFSLDEIRGMLESPAYDVGRALRLQKAALDRRIAQLQEASGALGAALEQLGAAQPYDWGHAITILRAVGDRELQRWMRRFFSDEQLGQLAAEASPEEQRAGERVWLELLAEFQGVRHLPPEDERVLALAARMQGLVRAFTRDDPERIAALRAMYSQLDAMPLALRPFDADLFTFMNDALRAYMARMERTRHTDDAPTAH